MTLQGLNGANRFTEALGLGARRQFGPGGIFDTRTERGSATAYSIALFLVLIAALARWGLGLLSPLLCLLPPSIRRCYLLPTSADLGLAFSQPFWGR